MKKFQQTGRQFLNGKKQFRYLTIFLSGLLALGISIGTGAINQNRFTAKAQTSQNVLTGQWTADYSSKKPDEFHIMMIRQSEKTRMGSVGVSFVWTDLTNLTSADVKSSTKKDVNFRIVREAGIFEFEGSFRANKGAGFWKMTPDRNFVAAMRERGFKNLTEEDFFAAVIGNVTVKTYEDLKSAGFENLSFDDLFRTAAFDVTPEFIRSWRTTEFKDLTLDDLLELGTFNVTPEFLKEIRAEGFDQISPQDAIQLKVHDIDLEYIRRVKAKGFSNATLWEIIELRNHEIIR